MPLEKSGIEYTSKGFTKFIADLGNAGDMVAKFGQSCETASAQADTLTKAYEGLNQQASDIGKKVGQANKDVGETSRDAAKGVDEETKSFGDLSAALGKAAEGFGKWAGRFAKIGGLIGGVLSIPSFAVLLADLIPGTEALAGLLPVLGALVGGIVGLQVDIGIAIKDFFSTLIYGITSFLPKTLQKITNAAMSIAGAFLELGKKVLSAVGNVVKSVIEAVKGLFSAFSGGGAGGGYKNLGGSMFEAMFKFEVLKQVIRKVIQEIKDLVNMAVTAAQELQTLTIRLDNLIARQIRAAGITNDYSKSISIASDYTQELLSWIQELAVATPFGEKAISRVVSLSMAMGWGIESTKELTNAILDYAAAQGLEDDIMERIIYNFAQMRQAGKVTGTELRDLARGAFMPVNDILNEAAKQLGIAADQMDEFRAAAADGTIDVETFFDAFITVANRDFPDAARRLNNTFEAVRDNVKDLFRTLVGWNILKPAFDSIARSAQKLIDAIYTPEVVRATKIIGISLKYVVDMVQMAMHNLMMSARQMFLALGLGLPTLENLVKSMVKFGGSIVKISFMIQNFVLKNLMPTIRSIGDEIEGVLGDSSDAFSWGFNLIMEFGKGMMRGVSTILTGVMNFIANMLSGWLMGHSPPRIAPEIDLWGLNTMAEWLRGFTEADFGILDSMKDNLRGALDALVDLGELDEQLSAEMYVNISADLIAAIEEFNRTGEMTEVIFEQLSTVSGVFGEELINLLNMQIELAEATERVADAQEAYNAAVDATEQATSTVHSLVREYNAMLRAGTDNSILEQRLAELNAAELQMLASQEAEQAAQAELDAAEAALDPIREMVALQEELIQQLIDLARAQADAAEAAYDGGGGGGGAGEDGGLPEDVGIGLPDLGPMEDLEAWFEEIKDTALAELRDMWDVLKREWASTFESSFGYSSPFQNAWRRFVNALRTYWDETLAPALGLPSWQAIADIWEGLDLFPEDPEYNISNPPWMQPDMGIEEGGGGIFNILDGIDDIILRLQETWNLFVDSILKNKYDPEGTEGGILSDLITAFQSISGFISDVVAGEITLRTIGADLGRGLVDGLIEGIREKLLEQPIIQLFGQVITWVRGLFGEKSPSTVFAEIGGYLVEGLFQGVLGWITDGWATMETALNNFIDGVLEFFGMGKGKSSISGGSSSVFLEVGTALITSLATGVTDTIAAIIGVGGVIATTIQSIIDAVKDALGIGGDGVSWEFTTIGRSIIDGMIAGITEMVDALLAAAEDAVEGVPQFIKDLIGFGSPAKMFIEIGASIPQGLAKGIRDEAGLAQKAMASASRGLFSSASVSGMNVAPMRATVQAPPASAGSSVTFGDVYVNDRIDLATLRTYVQQMILEN